MISVSRASAFRFVIGLVLLNAAVGILVLLIGGEIGSVEARVLLTSLCVSAAGIVCLPCAAAWERTRGKQLFVLPAGGITAIVLGFALIIAGMWLEIDEDVFWRFVASTIAVGCWLSHACLLVLCPLPQRYHWLKLAASAAAGLLVAELLVLFWGDGDVSDNMARALGITFIIVLAMSLLVPVIQRWQASPSDRPETSGPGFCPRCAAALTLSNGAGACSACGARFRVELLD